MRTAGRPTGSSRRSGQSLAVQRGHRRQGAGAPDDAGPQGCRRGPAGQDDHLRQEPRPRRVHRERFDANYPHYKGEFARVIDFPVELCAEPDRRVLARARRRTSRSRSTCWTRGSTCPKSSTSCSSSWCGRRPSSGRWSGAARRLCPDLFGPGRHKEFFYIFDYLREPRILQPGSANHQRLDGGIARDATLQNAPGADWRTGRRARDIGGEGGRAAGLLRSGGRGGSAP